MHIDITSGIFWRIMYEKSFINVTTWNLKFVWPLINCHKSSRCDFKVFLSQEFRCFTVSTKTCYVLTSPNNDVDAAEESRKQIKSPKGWLIRR